MYRLLAALLTIALGSTYAFAGEVLRAPQAPGAEDAVIVLGQTPKSESPTTLRVNPIIPSILEDDHKEGWVHVRLQIRPDGTVADAHLVESYPQLLFDSAVMKVVPGWKFKPILDDRGVPASVIDVGVAFYLDEFEVKRGHGYGYWRDFSLVPYVTKSTTTERLVMSMNTGLFRRTLECMERHDIDCAGEGFLKLRDRYRTHDLFVTDIARTFAMLARYANMTGHPEAALNEARRALQLARFFDNGRMVNALHVETISALLSLGRNDEAVDYYDSWRKKEFKTLSKEGLETIEAARSAGAGKGHVYTIVDFFDANYKQKRAMKNKDYDQFNPTLETAVEVLSFDYPAPPDGPSMMD